MTTAAADPFPRSQGLPTQSPKYWVKEKDRYLRQLLIRDIEAASGRPLFVYFSQLDQEITATDADDVAEILSGIVGDTADLLIQTPGGNVDATEKIISILKHRLKSFRVIVPSWAKSAGTVISLSSDEIVFGLNSELGPIDPQLRTASGTFPCEILAQDPAIPKHVRDMMEMAVKRMRTLATDILQDGMCKTKKPHEVEEIIKKISSSTGYHSHGAVIDYDEAIALGLAARYVEPDTDEWKRYWLLYCMYDYDTKAKGLGKICEGSKFSIARPK